MGIEPIIAFFVAVAILVAITFTRSEVLGFFVGGISGALIAVVVFREGNAGHNMAMMSVPLVMGVLFGIGGAVAGLVAGRLGTSMNSTVAQQKEEEQRDNGRHDHA